MALGGTAAQIMALRETLQIAQILAAAQDPERGHEQVTSLL
jgi:hypothetical protein